jgi:hypothetical protein
VPTASFGLFKKLHLDAVLPPMAIRLTPRCSLSVNSYFSN